MIVLFAYDFVQFTMSYIIHELEVDETVIRFYMLKNA